MNKKISLFLIMCLVFSMLVISISKVEATTVYVQIVDTQAPVITLLTPSVDMVNLNTDNFLDIKYLVLEDSPNNVFTQIILNEVKVFEENNTEETGSNYKITVNHRLIFAQGLNKVLIEAFDFNGNRGEKSFQVYCDSVPPMLTIKTLPELTTELNIEIFGEAVDKTSGLKTLTINGNSVFPDVTGSFKATLNLKTGENVLLIRAEDRFGNISMITKTIKRGFSPKPWEKGRIVLIPGIAVITVEGVSKNLGVAPIIKNGIVLVPLNLITDYLGARTDWFAPNKNLTFNLGTKLVMVQIGLKEAIISEGVKVKLKEGPQVINGHTLFPLEFIAEKLGFKVTYNVGVGTIVITRE